MASEDASMRHHVCDVCINAKHDDDDDTTGQNPVARPLDQVSCMILTSKHTKAQVEITHFGIGKRALGFARDS